MAKSNKKDKNKKNTRKTKTMWALTDSQKAILAQMQDRHRREQLPLKAYQQEQTRHVLIELQKELKIPEKYFDRLEFDFREAKFFVSPKESNTTKDLSKP